MFILGLLMLNDKDNLVNEHLYFDIIGIFIHPLHASYLCSSLARNFYNSDPQFGLDIVEFIGNQLSLQRKINYIVLG